jgi:hypothetical protein
MWVVQTDLYRKNERDTLLSILERFDISHQTVTLTSDGVLHPEVEHDGSIITNGSIMLSRIARERGWKPGGFLNDNFSYAVWHPHFREHLLNRDAVFTTLGEVDPHLDRFFLRPLADTKVFTGKVFERSDFHPADLGPLTTPVLYASVKALGQEHRHFVVDGRVITSSLYRMGGAVNYGGMVDDVVIAFAERMARLWPPARAFVMDTYVTGDEIGVVELGCIGNAGLYAADLQKLVMALDDLV